MTITEPMTMATDYLLAIISFGVSWKLVVTRKQGNRSVVLWALALAATGLAALAGGTFHGFRTTMPPPAAIVSWKITMIAIGLASFSFAGAIIHTMFAGRLRTLLLWVFAIKLITYLLVLTRYDDFQLAIYDYTPTMVGVLMAEFYVWWKRRGREALWIIAGIMVSFLGAIIQMGGRGFHEHFNHNDIYHVVQMVGVYCFYRAGFYLRDRT